MFHKQSVDFTVSRTVQYRNMIPKLTTLKQRKLLLHNNPDSHTSVAMFKHMRTAVINCTYDFLHFVDRASCNDSWLMTNVTHKFLSIYLFFYLQLSTCFEEWCSSSGEANCINTTSGNCHSVLMAVSCAHDTTLQFHPTPGSKRSLQLHKIYQSRCTAKNS